MSVQLIGRFGRFRILCDETPISFWNILPCKVCLEGISYCELIIAIIYITFFLFIFFLALLRDNLYTALYKLTVYIIITYMPHEMIITISLMNIYANMDVKLNNKIIFFPVIRTLRNYFVNNLHI